MSSVANAAGMRLVPPFIRPPNLRCPAPSRTAAELKDVSSVIEEEVKAYEQRKSLLQLPAALVNRKDLAPQLLPVCEWNVV